MTAKKRITRRTADRLRRAAYEYEALASALRHEGWTYEADSAVESARLLGKAGRSLAEKMEGK